jgi:hypothetical protein
LKCHICDRDLSDTEVIFSNDTQTYEPCTTCLNIVMEAAYCEGFVKEEPYPEIEIFEDETEVLEPEFERLGYGFADDRYTRQSDEDWENDYA